MCEIQYHWKQSSKADRCFDPLQRRDFEDLLGCGITLTRNSRLTKSLTDWHSANAHHRVKFALFNVYYRQKI